MRKSPARFPDVPKGELAPRLAKEEVVGCPVRASLGLLGRKWTLLILRDLTFYPGITFGQIRRRNPGITARILSKRLGELRAAGLLEKIADATDDRVFHYRLTPKGRDTVPVMTALAAFGLKHLAREVFKDGQPRSLGQVFPGEAGPLLGDLARFARGPGRLH